MSEVLLYQGNCLEVMKSMSSESVDCIVTDSPYKVTSKGNSGNSGGMLKDKTFMKGNVFSFNAVKPEMYSSDFYRLLKDGGHCYVMTNHINLQHMLNTFTECGFHFVKSLIWDKGNKIMGHYYMSQFEYILFFRKGRGKRINNCGTSDILSFPNKKTKDEFGKNLHPTEKPVDLTKVLIENSTLEGEIVFDPFMGIGSTGVAAKETNRFFIGVELDSNFFNTAQGRLNCCLSANGL